MRRAEATNVSSATNLRPLRNWAPITTGRVASRLFEGASEGDLPDCTPNPSSLCFCNRLSFFLPAWTVITSDCWVLNAEAQGYTLQFLSSPPPIPSLSLFRDASHESLST